MTIEFSWQKKMYIYKVVEKKSYGNNFPRNISAMFKVTRELLQSNYREIKVIRIFMSFAVKKTLQNFINSTL